MAESITIGVPNEARDGERRVALVPDVVKRLRARGVDVAVEATAGDAALIPDRLFTDAGASTTDNAWSADVVLTVGPPRAQDIERMRPGAVLVGFLSPLTQPETIAGLDAHGVTAFAVESIPRISRAQAMDGLSSQSTVAGYKAVLIAAEAATRFFPMLTTAAGTIPPARVLVLGAGVAGLQALATARRLGARTTGFDVRPETAEQVRSVGAEWLDLGLEAAGEGGYARELSDDERAAQQQSLTDAITAFDVVITTALVPGRPAPRLVTADAVERMRPGSVVVDLAGASGGNCEVSVAGTTVVVSDVSVCAPLDVPSSMPEHASQMYARNLLSFLELIVSPATQERGAALHIDFDDEIVAGACVAGRAVHASTTAPES